MSKKPPIKRIKTGFLSRRLALAKTGMRYGSKVAWQLAKEQLNSSLTEEQRSAQRREQAEFLVEELSKLKGSVVKIGQLMGSYGEYFLPKEITEALLTLNDDGVALKWEAMERQLIRELGKEKLSELEIDPVPIAAASLGQVHRARSLSDGAELCLKIQYPGVAKTIDSDFDAVIQLMSLARILDSGRDLRAWLKEVKGLLKQEVDYRFEAQSLAFFANELAGDPRYVIPQVYHEFCADRVLMLSYESGLSVSDTQVSRLSKARRNALGHSILDLFLKELFTWQRMQTDPNFGNYRIRINEKTGEDQLVLLDFGAVRSISPKFVDDFKEMIKAAYRDDRQAFIQASIAAGFMQQDFPDKVLNDFADVAMDIIEPLKRDVSQMSEDYVNAEGEYHWKRSKLPKRVGKRAAQASLSRYFALPPQEFAYIIRKLSGVYTFVATLEAEFDGREILADL